jgi:hypothetical protein
MSAEVAAVVLASRGGPRLARALASVAWAEERIILDPAGRLRDEPLAVRIADDRVPEDGRAPWLLLLEEREAVPPELVAAIREAIGAADLDGYRIGQELSGFGTTFVLRGAPLRLARRRGTRLRVGPLGVELDPPSGRIGRLRLPLVVATAPLLATVVEELDADATVLAALLHARGVRPGLRHLAVSPLVPGARTLAARGQGRARGARWALTVVGAYRTAVAYAKLWERRRAEGSSLQ